MRLRAFQPFFFQGQSCCYRPNPATLGQTPTAGQGVVHSLMMLLDVNRERSSSLVLADVGEDASQKSSSKLDLSSIPRLGLAKINIHTLSTFQGFGSAHYKMSVLKQTTGSAAFSALPGSKKKCSLEIRESCEARLWIDHLRKTCKCQPVSLAVLNIQVMTSKTLAWSNAQGLAWCGPNGTMCAQSLNVSDCLVSCDGFYGDVAQEKQEGGNEKNALKLGQLLSEYNRHKSGLAKNLVYRSRSPKFSKCPLPLLPS